MTTNNLLNSDMEFDPSQVEGIDQDSVEGGGPSFPLLQWAYGNIKDRKRADMDGQGGFFVKGDRLDAAVMEAAGWTKTERTFKSGASEEGYWKREAAVSIIAERKRWEIVGADGKRQVFPWNKFDAAKTAIAGSAPRGRNQYLVLIKGLEESGPFVLTLKGSGAMAFESFRDKDAVLSRFANTVIRAANAASDAAAKKAADLCRGWEGEQHDQRRTARRPGPARQAGTSGPQAVLRRRRPADPRQRTVRRLRRVARGVGEHQAGRGRRQWRDGAGRRRRQGTRG